MQDICFELADTRLTGLTNGQHGKPLVLALHGWLDNAASFLPLAPLLKDYHLVALDFAGHGHSSHRNQDSYYHQADFVYDLHELVDSQGWESFILLGHSMGGIVGSQYVSAFPDRVRAFITIESFGPVTKSPDTSPQQLREAIESRMSLANRAAKHPQSIATATKARADTGQLSTPSAELLVTRNIEQTAEGLKWRTDRRLRTLSPQRMTEQQAEAFMRAISCPVLAVRGSTGFDMMKDKLAQRSEWVSSLVTATCEGGHHVHMDNPVDVGQEIIYFLEQELGA